MGYFAAALVAAFALAVVCLQPSYSAAAQILVSALVTVVVSLRRTVAPYSTTNTTLLDGRRRYVAGAQRPARGPNVLLVLFDDLGLGDLGVFGSRAIRTPALDALAAGGVASREFYAGASVCSPSRACLLTGRQPPRTGVGGLVLFPAGSFVDYAFRLMGYARGLLEDEITVATALGAHGWRTICVGKWHVGGVAPHLPTDHGFSSFYGVLHSNDMAPFELWRATAGGPWRLEAAEAPQERLTGLYTNESIAQIEAAVADGARWFLYLAFNAPHDPLHVRRARAGRSRAGVYGDVVEEADEAVGTLTAALARLRLARDTLVVATSDNGPWYEGATAGQRERKASAFDGGFRVPFIARWPAGGVGGRRRARWLRVPTHGADLMPTILAACGVPLPSDRVIDGRDVLELWRKPPPRECRRRDAPTAACERALPLYVRNDLAAVRRGHLKLHLSHLVRPDELVRARTLGSQAERRGWMWLTDLEVDPEEAYDASEARLADAEAMAHAAADVGDALAANPRGAL